MFCPREHDMRRRGPSKISRLNAAINAGLMLVVLAMWALVPQGYMLAGPVDGRLMSVELCSGGGHPLFVDLDTGEIVQATAASDNDRPQPASTSEKSCAFATVPLGLTASPPGQIAMAAHVVVIVWNSPAETREDTPTIAMVPWSTGPPYSV